MECRLPQTVEDHKQNMFLVFAIVFFLGGGVDHILLLAIICVIQMAVKKDLGTSDSLQIKILLPHIQIHGADFQLLLTTPASC